MLKMSTYNMIFLEIFLLEDLNRKTWFQDRACLSIRWDFLNFSFL